MKKIILSVVLVAFGFAVQAGDTKACQAKDSSKASCCASKSTEQAKGGCCPMTGAKSACKDKQAKQTVLASPKAASFASK
jgi:hypothetical protein